MLGLSQEEKHKALKTAIETARFDDIDKLLKKGVDMNAQPWVCYAVGASESDDVRILILKRLLDAGASVDMPDESRQFPLHLALKSHRLVHFLLEKGADPLRRNASGQTPLMCACTRERISSAQMLARRGGMTAIRDEYGDTHLMHICAYPYFNHKDEADILSVLKNIIAGLPDELNKTREDDGRTALHLAIEMSNNTRLVEHLLAAPGIDINIADKKGDTPLDLAVKARRFDVVNKLLWDGASLDRQGGDKPGFIELFAAAGMMEAMYKAIRHASKGGKAPNLLPAFWRAAEEGQDAALQHLIEMGVDINAGNPMKGNATALMLAVKARHSSIVDRLCAAGADLDLKDSEGKTARDMMDRFSANALSDILSVQRFRQMREAQARRQVEAASAEPEPPAQPVDRRVWHKQGDDAISCELGGGLTMTFNFWTRQAVMRDTAAPAMPLHVQSFDDLPRQAVIAEAREKLVALGGTPPEDDVMLDKKATPALRIAAPQGGA